VRFVFDGCDCQVVDRSLFGYSSCGGGRCLFYKLNIFRISKARNETRVQLAGDCSHISVQHFPGKTMSIREAVTVVRFAIISSLIQVSSILPCYLDGPKSI
jgi:hypothetical protein